MLVGALAGRAAEELIFDTVTTGASNDIERATAIARAMITQYGMSEKFGLIGLESIQNRYLDGRAVRNCAEATAAEIDKEIMETLRQAYEEAKTLLAEHRETLDRIAAFLIEKETITGKEFMEIFHQIEGDKAEGEPGEKEAGGDARIMINPVSEAILKEAAASQEDTVSQEVIASQEAVASQEGTVSQEVIASQETVTSQEDTVSQEAAASQEPVISQETVASQEVIISREMEGTTEEQTGK